MISAIFKKFGNPGKGVDEGLEKSIVETLANIRKEAVEFAPNDKGELRNSIMYTTPDGSERGFNEYGGDKKATDKITENGKPLTGYVGTAAPHGVYQEFGTRNMSPQPFMRPAVALVEGKPKDYVVKQINKSINKWTKGSVKIVKF